MSFTSNFGMRINGNDTIVNIYDSNPNTEHKYYVDPTYHYWVLDEQQGDHIVKGGLIYAPNHGCIMYCHNEENNVVRTININGGTICGGYYESACNLQCSGENSRLYLTMDGGAISGNARRLFYGGPAVYLQGAATFTLKNGLISDNYCNLSRTSGPTDNNGGAIFATSKACEVKIEGGLITRNTAGSLDVASNYGGAIYSVDATITIDGGEISDNTVYGNAGGGVSVSHAGTIVINGGLITRNKVVKDSDPSRGGGVYNGPFGNLQLHGGEISYNEAGTGGGVYSAGAINYEASKGKELKIVHNKAITSDGGAYGSGTVKGKVIIADNECLDPNAPQNLHFSIGGASPNPMVITGDLTGSIIHFNADVWPARESVAFTNYNLSRAKTDFATEFLHYDGSSDFYMDFNNEGNIVIDVAPTDNPVHTIARSFDSKMGSLLTNYDAIYSGKTVKIMCNPYKGHTLKSLLAYYNDEGEYKPLQIIDNAFEMPDAEVLVEAKFSHDEVVLVKGKKPTCTEDGWKDYYRCRACNEYFEDEAATEPIEDLETWKINEGRIEKTPHPLKLIKGRAPTCTKDGWKDYYRCTECGDLFADEAATSPIDDLAAWKIGDGKLPMIPHPLKLVRGKAPTLTEPGYKDYYKCIECNDYFEDKEGTIQILDIKEWKVTKGAVAPIMGGKNLTITLLVIVAVIIIPIVTVVSVNEIKKRRYLHVNNNYLFSDIKYSRTTHPTAPSLDEHTFDFIYQGEHVYYYIFTRKVDKVTDKEVKAKFQEILKSGKLRKYSSHYYKKIY